MNLDATSELLARLRHTGALLEGHFCLSSGLHSAAYVQCARLLQYPEHAAWAAAALAPTFTGQVDVVVGPALGGVIIAHELARALGVRCLFTERENGQMVFRRGFSLHPGERVLVAEDVMTTGGSALEAAACAQAAGGVIAGFACLVDRGGAAHTTPPAAHLLRLSFETFAPDACPMCREAMPLTKPGSRTSPRGTP